MCVFQTWYLAYWWVSTCFFHEMSYVKGLDPPFLSLFSVSFVLPSIPQIPVLWTPGCKTLLMRNKSAGYMHKDARCRSDKANMFCLIFKFNFQAIQRNMRHSWTIKGRQVTLLVRENLELGLICSQAYMVLNTILNRDIKEALQSLYVTRYQHYIIILSNGRDN